MRARAMTTLLGLSLASLGIIGWGLWDNVLGEPIKKAFKKAKFLIKNPKKAKQKLKQQISRKIVKPLQKIRHRAASAGRKAIRAYHKTKTKISKAVRYAARKSGAKALKIRNRIIKRVQILKRSAKRKVKKIARHAKKIARRMKKCLSQAKKALKKIGKKNEALISETQGKETQKMETKPIKPILIAAGIALLGLLLVKGAIAWNLHDNAYYYATHMPYAKNEYPIVREWEYRRLPESINKDYPNGYNEKLRRRSGIAICRLFKKGDLWKVSDWGLFYYPVEKYDEQYIAFYFDKIIKSLIMTFMI